MIATLGLSAGAVAVIIGWVITGRAVYRMSRDQYDLAQRIARLEGERDARLEAERHADEEEHGHDGPG